jgi:hypothetical protein
MDRAAKPTQEDKRGRDETVKPTHCGSTSPLANCRAGRQ